MTCKHQHGAHINALGAWVCGQCFKLLGDRPRRYGIAPFEPNGTERQEIVWQAEVKKSAEGTTLATFLEAVARRFQSRDTTLTDSEAVKLAIEAVQAMDTEFGHPDYDWSRTTAIDVADEEMTYWDCGSAATN